MLQAQSWPLAGSRPCGLSQPCPCGCRNYHGLDQQRPFCPVGLYIALVPSAVSYPHYTIRIFPFLFRYIFQWCSHNHLSPLDENTPTCTWCIPICWHWSPLWLKATHRNLLIWCGIVFFCAFSMICRPDRVFEHRPRGVANGLVLFSFCRIPNRSFCVPVGCVDVGRHGTDAI